MTRYIGLLVVMLAIIVCGTCEAGLLGGLRGGRGGGGGGDCSDGSCGRPIGLGLKKPGAEVGSVEGDRMLVKMYAPRDDGQYAQQQQTELPPPDESVNPLFYALAGVSPFLLCIPALIFAGTFIAVRRYQESNDED